MPFIWAADLVVLGFDFGLFKVVCRFVLNVLLVVCLVGRLLGHHCMTLLALA